MVFDDAVDEVVLAGSALSSVTFLKLETHEEASLAGSSAFRGGAAR